VRRIKVTAQEQLKLQVQAGAPGQAQNFVRTFSASYGVCNEDSARALIVVEELVTNLVKYGYQGRPCPGTAEVGLFLEKGRLTIELVDDGGEFDPFTAPVPDIDRQLETHTPGGMGLRIVRLLTEGGNYSRVGDRNITRMTLPLSAPARAAAS
jgi:anti-sigma regulatory factor (Ser/Thr protein kinase)